MSDTKRTSHMPLVLGGVLLVTLVVVAGLTQPWTMLWPSSSPVAATYDQPVAGMADQYRDFDPDLPVPAFSQNEASGPVFDCPQNDGKPRVTYGDVDKLTPCWNGAVHVLVKNGVPGLQKYTNVNGDSASTEVVQPKDQFVTYQAGKEHWKFSVIHSDSTDAYHADFVYLAGMNTHFAASEIYYRTGGGLWQVGGNFNDKSFAQGETLEAVMVFRDTRVTSTSTDVPFIWNNMAKGSSLPHFVKR